MLYDVDETYTIDAMSLGHFEDFIGFLREKTIEEVKAAVVPEEKPWSPVDSSVKPILAEGWNDCRAQVLENFNQLTK